MTIGPDDRDVAAIIALMRTNPGFHPLSDPALDLLARKGGIDRGAEGHRFFAQGDRGDFAYLVIEGEVAVDVTTGKHEVTVATVGPGGLVGEVAAFAATPRTASITARRDTALIRIEQATIRELLKDSPETAMAIIAELGKRLAAINGTMAMLTQAAQSLAAGDYRPGQLDRLRAAADRFGHFAEVFDGMAQEITNKRLWNQEMRTAAEIQASFLPGPIMGGPHRAWFDVAAQMRAAKDVGGDFYDYFMIDDETVGFAVGDVSGKGVPAAMFMSVSRTVLKTLAREGEESGTVLTRLNDLLAEDNAEGMFVTVAFARLNLVTGALDYACGAHEEVYLRAPDGTVTKSDAMGPAIGLFQGPVFATQRMDFAPGTTMVLATDGITEAFATDGSVYGNDRLEAGIAAHAGLAPDLLVAALCADVDRFAEGCPQSDDITCLALHYRPAPPDA